jgi:hypothetical protein
VVGHSGKHWAFLCLRDIGLLLPQSDRLQLSRGAGFLMFDGAAEALPWEGLVVSTGPPCTMGREVSWHQKNSKPWSLGFTSFCGSLLLALSSKLRVPVGQQSLWA